MTQAAPARFRAVIADDHQIVRAGLKTALETPGLVEPEGIAVIAEAANGFEAIAAVKEHSPDLLLLDVAMPHLGGGEAVFEIRRWRPETRIVVFTAVTAGGLIGGLVQAGVDGMFSKAAPMEALYAKLPLILRGGRYVAPEFLALMERQSASSSLTKRERQTLNMILAGKSSKEIAATMCVSPKTVEKHRTSLMAKLDVHSVAELMARALRDGLIDNQSVL